MITYTTSQVASMFHVTPKTIYNWVDGGKLHPIRSSKRSGAKLLFLASEVDALFAPVWKEVRKDVNELLAAALVGISVKLSIGVIDIIKGVGQDPNSQINVLTESHGWFSLAGDSLARSAPGIGRINIINYYVDSRHA